MQKGGVVDDLVINRVENGWTITAIAGEYQETYVAKTPADVAKIVKSVVSNPIGVSSGLVRESGADVQAEMEDLDGRRAETSNETEG